MNGTDHVGTKEALLGVGEGLEFIVKSLELKRKELFTAKDGKSAKKSKKISGKEREKRIKVRLCVPDEVMIKGMRKGMVFSVRGFEGFVAI